MAANIMDTLPEGLADAAIAIPGFGTMIQVVMSKFGLDAGNLMSMYLLLFGIYQGVMFVYRQGKHYLLYVSSVALIESEMSGC